MAKSNLGKMIAGITIIGAGVALGLTIFNKLDTIKRELESDEFEDDFNDEEEDDKDFPETEYVTINPASSEDHTDKETVSDEADKDTE